MNNYFFVLLPKESRQAYNRTQETVMAVQGLVGRIHLHRHSSLARGTQLYLSLVPWPLVRYVTQMRVNKFVFRRNDMRPNNFFSEMCPSNTKSKSAKSSSANSGVDVIKLFTSKFYVQKAGRTCKEKNTVAYWAHLYITKKMNCCEYDPRYQCLY